MPKTSENLPATACILPDGFESIGPATMPEDARPPYVQFMYAIMDSYRDALLKFNDLEEGEPVLQLPKPYEPILLRPFRFFLMKLTEFWGRYTPEGLTEMSRTQKPYEDGFRQTYDTVLLVISPEGDKLIPATCRFKATTLDGCRPCYRAIQEAKTPSWEKKHADIVSEFPRNASVRVYGHAEVRENKSGRPILIGQAHPNKQYIGLVKDFFFGPKKDINLALYNAVVDAYDRRLMDAFKKDLVAA